MCKQNTLFPLMGHDICLGWQLKSNLSDAEIEFSQNNGYIYKNQKKNTWVSRISTVPKKDGSLRIKTDLGELRTDLW